MVASVIIIIISRLIDLSWSRKTYNNQLPLDDFFLAESRRPCVHREGDCLLGRWSGWHQNWKGQVLWRRYISCIFFSGLMGATRVTFSTFLRTNYRQTWCRNRMLTSLVLMVVIVMTWLFGVLAMNNTDRKIFHYVFIVFYTFQVRDQTMDNRLDPLTPKISSVILLTVSHAVLVMLVGRIWYWINL